MKRLGRDRFVRNVLVAIGNSGERGLARVAEALLCDSSPLVRGMAVWAAARLVDPARLRHLQLSHAAAEDAPDVCAEWRAALETIEATEELT